MNVIVLEAARNRPRKDRRTDEGRRQEDAMLQLYRRLAPKERAIVAGYVERLLISSGRMPDH